MPDDGNKPKINIKGGFKITNERLLFIVLIIIIFAFIFFLPTIYEKIMYIKVNGLFPKEEVVEEIPKEKEEEEEKVVTTCTKTETKESGKISYKVTFNHPNDMIKSTTEVTSYISNEGVYMDEIDVANKYFTELAEDFDRYDGFKIKTTITQNTYKAELILDLSLLDIKKMNEIVINKPLELKYTYNQKIKEVTKSYINDGYACK